MAVWTWSPCVLGVVDVGQGGGVVVQLDEAARSEGREASSGNRLIADLGDVRQGDVLQQEAGRGDVGHGGLVAWLG